MRMFLIGLLFSSTSLSALAERPAFSLEPGSTVLSGDPIEVRLSGLPAESEIEVTAERIIHSSLLGNRKLLFRSQALFQTDASGKLDLATAVPRSGSYQGADVRGLFWSMTPTDDSLPAEAQVGRIELFARHDGTVLARTDLRMIGSDPKVVVEQLEAFPGAVLARLPGKSRLPVIILLGGAEGGSRAARDESVKLASFGFAVLGLPYYSPPSMPGGPREIPELPADFADIPVERLNAVRDWIKTRKDLDANRIGLYGASKGAEFALLGASHFDWIKAVVAVAPSDVVWEGWGFGLQPGQRGSFALNGKTLPFVPYKNFVDEYMGFMTGAAVHLRRPHDQGRAANPGAAVAARIPIENFKGALLLIAGQDDQLWNSAMMAHNLAERRAQAGLPVTALIYSDAGHYLNGNGWSPTTHFNMGQEKTGGTPAGNARAQADAWPRMLAFLRTELGPR